ncbi:MAG: hypothetical protein V3W37_11720, partial [Candidatus Binatia bacterium]
MVGNQLPLLLEKSDEFSDVLLRDFSSNCLNCLCDHSPNLKRQSQSIPLPRLFSPSWFFKQDPDPHHSPKILVDLQGVAPLSGLSQAGTFFA